MKTLREFTLAEIVKRNYKAGVILERYSLDFCCCGQRTLALACQVKNVDPVIVERALETELKNESDGVNFELWPLKSLIDYICTHHHAYIEEAVPILKSQLHKICELHGHTYPEINEVRRIFFELAGELIIHMKQEEFKLFPFIKKLELNEGALSPPSSPLFRTVNQPVQMMQDDHAVEGRKLAKIAILTNNYSAPAAAGKTVMVTYGMLSDLARDLRVHIHLENNILFPKAIKLEAQRLTDIDEGH